MGAQHLSGFLRGLEKRQVEQSTSVPEIQVRGINCELNHGVNVQQAPGS